MDGLPRRGLRSHEIHRRAPCGRLAGPPGDRPRRDRTLRELPPAARGRGGQAAEAARPRGLPRGRGAPQPQAQRLGPLQHAEGPRAARGVPREGGGGRAPLRVVRRRLGRRRRRGDRARGLHCRPFAGHGRAAGPRGRVGRPDGAALRQPRRDEHVPDREPALGLWRRPHRRELARVAVPPPGEEVSKKRKREAFFFRVALLFLKGLAVLLLSNAQHSKPRGTEEKLTFLRKSPPPQKNKILLVSR